MKQRIAVYGDCQAQCLYRLLCRSANLADDFEFVLQFVGDQHRDWRAWEQSLPGISCMFVQDIPQAEAHPVYHTAYSANRRLLSFPALSFPSLWPFSVAFGGADRQADEIRAAIPGPHFHKDALLSALRPIRDHAQRLSCYLRLDPGGIERRPAW